MRPDERDQLRRRGGKFTFQSQLSLLVIKIAETAFGSQRSAHIEVQKIMLARARNNA